MSGRGKRKSFGSTKKHACDMHHCKKAKKVSATLSSVVSGIKHSRVHKTVE